MMAASSSLVRPIFTSTSAASLRRAMPSGAIGSLTRTLGIELSFSVFLFCTSCAAAHISQDLSGYVVDRFQNLAALCVIFVLSQVDCAIAFDNQPCRNTVEVHDKPVYDLQSSKVPSAQSVCP